MKKILVANRGEIALRVMKTAKKMGIGTVAIYSTTDRNMPHVKFADEAMHIGDNPSTSSYLKGDRIIDAAKQIGADAIHPGYGFLSENAAFASAVEHSGLTFIGPGSEAIRTMGDKLAAKAAVKKYRIPMVPGVDSAISELDKAMDISNTIGFPVLIKAAAGGGGKGMRIVDRPQELREQMQRAVSEARSAFGDGSVFIEKYIASPRHIEFQVLADNHGNVVHLFERECSIQRRHQKVLEEAPSAIMTAELRDKMGKAAVQVARACNYRGAGTVEFLVDEKRNFYFLEMNTRLQVEHPVTEYVTGLDLVEEQIKIARGEKLGFRQEDLQLCGHALELRVYAEDSYNDFLPNVGKLLSYRIPKGKNIRLDDGYEQGMEIPIYYDPMISKLITYGKDRNSAIQLMLIAIDQYCIEGVQTTLPFGRFVCGHEAFRSGDFDTHFVKKYYSGEALKKIAEEKARVAAMLALRVHLEEKKRLRTPGAGTQQEINNGTR